MDHRESAALLALDWGSSRLRAYLIGPAGQVLQRRESGAGASLLAREGFEPALRALVADWLQPGLPALACGMVGSAHGWREADYQPCPARPASLAGSITVAGSGDATVHIVAGLCIDRPDAPDVMRGEETQIVGVLHERPDLAARALLVMPGTHSKWVHVEAGSITGFATRMTGELFALLRAHSVLGRLLAGDDGRADDAAFERGVLDAQQGGAADLAHCLFRVRALGLRAGWPAHAQREYLSGLLIGSEVVAGVAGVPAETRLALVGEASLCERYARALTLVGREPMLAGEDVVATGLWVLARLAGLV